MSFLSDEERLEAISEAKTYDYIRFSWPDLNGIPRGKTVPGRHAENFINSGIWEYTGTISMGPRTELPFIEKIDKQGYGNSQFLPASKLFDLSWVGHDKYKVGQFICEAYWPDGTQVAPAPRSVARKQLDRLADMGLKFYSGFEVEFLVVDAKTKEPVTDGVDFGSDLVLSKHLSWLFDVEKHLIGAGVDIGAMHPEYSPGQFEFCMEPKYGIDTCDDMYVLRQALKEILPKYGYQPSFMTRPIGNDGGSNGAHFNHSLWDTEGKSVFYDDSKPLNMSDTMRYWVGGIMKHIVPLTALCCPTPNCYRRLHAPWAPDKADWGIDNRFVSVRVKNRSPGSALVENRLPSGSSNPYITVAATIAAGIDGIRNKIEPPPIGQNESNPPLPDFTACLDALKKDTVLVEALGAEFIDWWLAIKDCEMEKFGKHSMTEMKEEEIALEKKEYFDFI